MKNQVQDNKSSLQEKYFLISKGWTVAFVLLALVSYGAAVLWSEFVFSVSSVTSQEGRRKSAEMMKKNVCATNGEASMKYGVNESQFPDSRNPLLFDKNYRSGTYDDFLFDYPGCLAESVVSTEQSAVGSTIYYFDRATNKPTVKVTIESVK